MMFLLDTNVVLEMRKIGDNRIDENVLAYVASAHVAATFVSAITITELEIGILRLERRDSARAVVSGRLWQRMFFPSSKITLCHLILQLPRGALIYMFQTQVLNAMHWSRRPP